MACPCDSFTRTPVLPALACERRLPGLRLTPSGSRAELGHARGNARRSSVSCSAGYTVDRSPLSSYKFPQIPSGSVHSTPLENSVKEAVGHLDQAPFLQLHHRGNIDRHSVDNSVLEEPQLWKGIAGYLREKNTEMILLLYPLDAPAKSRAPQAARSAGEVMTGITNASHQSRVLSFAELVRAGATTADFSGRVGECCEQETHNQVVAFPRQRPHAKGVESQRSARGGKKGAISAPRSLTQQQDTTNYWGVVLQSRDGQNAGCYVLKTSHSAVGDCTCVHWALTRVCSGAPLFDQVSSAWLL